jgi:hypothetical protein
MRALANNTFKLPSAGLVGGHLRAHLLASTRSQLNVAFYGRDRGEVVRPASAVQRNGAGHNGTTEPLVACLCSRSPAVTSPALRRPGAAPASWPSGGHRGAPNCVPLTGHPVVGARRRCVRCSVELGARLSRRPHPKAGRRASLLRRS